VRSGRWQLGRGRRLRTETAFTAAIAERDVHDGATASRKAFRKRPGAVAAIRRGMDRRCIPISDPGANAD